MLRNILLLLVVMAVGACETDTAPRIGPSAFSGDARVVDGDTLYVDDIKVRLNGIDAPEVGSPYGAAATRALSNIVKDRKVICQPNGDTSFDRIVARCFVDETDIAAAVIAAGVALDCPRFSNGRYRRYETYNARRRLPKATYC